MGGPSCRRLLQEIALSVKSTDFFTSRLPSNDLEMYYSLHIIDRYPGGVRGFDSAGNNAKTGAVRLYCSNSECVDEETTSVKKKSHAA